MDLSSFSKGASWAIVPAHFETLARKVRELEGATEKDILSARIRYNAGKAESRDAGYDISGSVAVLPIHGALFKRENFLTWFLGLPTYEGIRTSFRQAMADPSVEAVVLDMDTPGGVVSGVEAAGEEIFNARGTKPIVAVASGMMASAGYWLGSAADVVMAENTADVGSIGVLMVHLDWSEFDKKIGLKTTYLSAGRYKAIGNDAEPLSQEAREVFQQELDYLYSLFVGVVGRNRDAEDQTVLTNMADGRVFIGGQAKAAGLVDEIGNLDAAVELARAMVDDSSKSNSKRRASMDTKDITTVEQLKTELPELCDQIFKDGGASIDAEAIRAEAANSTTHQVLDLAVGFFGEKLGEKFATLVETGVTRDQLAAIQGTLPAGNDTNAAMAGMLSALQNTGAPDPGTGDGGTGQSADFMSLVNDYRRQNKCSYAKAMSAVRKSNPESHQAYLRQVNQSA